MLKQQFAAAIESALLSKGLSKRGLAANLGWDHPQIHRILNGSNYNIDTLDKVLEELGLTVKIESRSDDK
jgi:transcriptional regulator with XRE-family HTH domain